MSVFFHPLVFLFFGLSSGILYYRMVYILDQHGKNSSINWFFITPAPYFKFMNLIKEVDDPRLKRGYKWILWGQAGLVISYLMIPVILILTA